MPTKSQYRLFAKIAPDPQRPSHQVRVRFDPKQPEAEPILLMLERTPFGETRTVVAQALRIGAAARFGEEPLSPPPPTRKKPFGSRRFVAVRREEDSPRSREDVYTIYDPRQPWNRHLEAIVSRCEWGETNRTMLELLLNGLRVMGYTRSVQASQGASEEPAAPHPNPPQPARRQPASVTIGVDPTQAQPRQPAPAINTLIRGAARRGEPG
jgi:hypothetical protein